jgi:hypothetical protein
LQRLGRAPIVPQRRKEGCTSAGKEKDLQKEKRHRDRNEEPQEKEKGKHKRSRTSEADKGHFAFSVVFSFYSLFLWFIL